MTKEEFVGRITDLVNNYIEYYTGGKGDNPQIRINPASLYTTFVADRDQLLDIGYSDEAIEEAAAADDAAYADAMDNQARQNPDYYPIKSLVITDDSGKQRPDSNAIEAIVNTYFN